jgi:hypothetical protein
MGPGHRIVYVCPTCLLVSDRQDWHHDQLMRQCDAGVPGDEQSKPIMTPAGDLVTHAPRWWVEKCLELHRSSEN